MPEMVREMNLKGHYSAKREVIIGMLYECTNRQEAVSILTSVEQATLYDKWSWYIEYVGVRYVGFDRDRKQNYIHSAVEVILKPNGIDMVLYTNEKDDWLSVEKRSITYTDGD